MGAAGAQGTTPPESEGNPAEGENFASFIKPYIMGIFDVIYM